MKKIKNIISIIIISFFIVPPAITAAAYPILIDITLSEYNPIRSIEFLEDVNREWTIKDVTGKKLHSRFKHAPDDRLTFGFTSSAYWLRFTVINIQDSQDDIRFRMEEAREAGNSTVDYGSTTLSFFNFTLFYSNISLWMDFQNEKLANYLQEVEDSIYIFQEVSGLRQ